eukprot:TRINITY_DN9133_c0_g2_i1.p1 TRINITY_DN9133_c0_g2~~TRINITY_DN9133_c0_g2_i1.p1  ORF type:complete len:578 (-),score=126.35 TRINITY_DN9133_c0_g2_i1:78-1787(-)
MVEPLGSRGGAVSSAATLRCASPLSATGGGSFASTRPPASPATTLFGAGKSSRYNPRSLWSTLKPEVGFDKFDEYDAEAEVTSPRSVQACAKEGILPEELTYKPPDLFYAAGVSDAVAQMRYEFAEARRQDLLMLAKGAYRKEMERAANPPDEEAALFGGLDSLEPPAVLENTVSFFRERLEDICPDVVSSLSPRKLASRGIPYIAPAPSTPISPKAPVLSRTWSAPTTLFADEDGLEGTMDPLSTLTPSDFRKTTGRLWTATPLARNPKASGAIIDHMLAQFKTAPRADRVEEDGATVMQNLIQTKRVFDERMRKRSNRKEMELVSKRSESSLANFRDAFCDKEENRQKFEFRHAMSLPPSRQGESRQPSFVRADRARERVHHDIAMRELKWTEELAHQTEKQHARTERLHEEYYMRKMHCARGVMSDRIRWRFSHDEVCAKREAYEEEKLRLFLKREEDMRNRKAKEANDNMMRQELRRLREVSRLMDEQRRIRRSNHQKGVKDELLQTRRLAEAASIQSAMAADAEELLEESLDWRPDSPGAASTASRARGILPHLARSKMQALMA